METMKVVPKSKLKFELDGQVYELNKPKVGDQKWFQKAMKEAKENGNEVEVTAEYVQRLGLAQEVIDEMEADQFLDLVKQINAVEKKTEAK